MSKKTIKEVVESYDVKLWPIGEGILRGFCPMHTNVNTASFTVYENTDSWFCFGESIGGDTASFIAKMDGIPYADAKHIVEGDVSLVEDMTQMLDAVAVIDDTDYKDQLNFAVSKHCRDLLYQHPEQGDKILNFLKNLDQNTFSKPVSYGIMKSVMNESRRLL